MDNETLSMILFIAFVLIAASTFIWNIAATIMDRKWMKNFESKWSSMTKLTDSEYLHLSNLLLSEKARIENNKKIEHDAKEAAVKKIRQIKEKLEAMKE